MKKKIISTIIIFCMLFSLPITTYANEGGEVIYATAEPRNTNIKYSTLSLSIIDGIAYCNASVTGYTTNTNHVSIYMYLQKYNNGNWTNYTSWNTSATNYYVNLNKQAYVSRGKYRLRVSYYAESENIIKYGTEEVY